MTEKDSLSAAEFRALAEFRYQLRRFLRFSEEAARTSGLEPQHHQALLALKGLPSGREATVGVLAERMQIQPHSAVELIDRLVERGLVMRTRSEVDRRQVLLQLTPLAERQLSQLSVHHRAQLLAMGPAMAQTLSALIDSVGAATREAEPAGGTRAAESVKRMIER